MAYSQDTAIIRPQMAEGLPCTHEDIIKFLEDTRVELEEKLNELEMLSVEGDDEKFGVWNSTTDGTYVNYKVPANLICQHL
ncbi:synaptonemal complex central element protein 3 isoform X4 [Scyliorhinus canicula]|uniref:synaptonemal complex central element protein 3 isoform X4 n=1 Tax=Scyliorhinus canicula TaxID=7830 RepID=UPI0018F3A243|nr:synaptonemal complex central element protein 3 isoform X4 [Scyliorhinus canicula]